jgi:hypothetical protein
VGKNGNVEGMTENYDQKEAVKVIFGALVAAIVALRVAYHSNMSSAAADRGKKANVWRNELNSKG